MSDQCILLGRPTKLGFAGFWSPNSRPPATGLYHLWDRIQRFGVDDFLEQTIFDVDQSTLSQDQDALRTWLDRGSPGPAPTFGKRHPLYARQAATGPQFEMPATSHRGDWAFIIEATEIAVYRLIDISAASPQPLLLRWQLCGLLEIAKAPSTIDALCVIESGERLVGKQTLPPGAEELTSLGV